jgi:hypothetical protein
MKIIDKTPLQSEKGEISLMQRLQGTLTYGFSWYAELEAQKGVIAQLDRTLEKGFTLIRNFTLPGSEIVEPIILIGPSGVYVIYVTSLKGFYEAKGDQWNTVSNGRSLPAPINLMGRVSRLARALQVYLERQGISLPGPVEPVIIAASPALHIDSLRPAVRVVLSDAVKQFGASLLQARPALRTELVYDLADRIITPRPKAAAPQLEPLGPPPTPQAEAQPASRAQAIFQASGEAKPFNASDLSFSFDENAAQSGMQVPQNLRETSPSQQLPRGSAKRSLSTPQLAFLGAMILAECCVVAGFVYFFFFASR